MDDIAYYCHNCSPLGLNTGPSISVTVTVIGAGSRIANRIHGDFVPVEPNV